MNRISEDQDRGGWWLGVSIKLFSYPAIDALALDYTMMGLPCPAPPLPRADLKHDAKPDEHDGDPHQNHHLDHQPVLVVDHLKNVAPDIPSNTGGEKQVHRCVSPEICS